MSSTKGETGPEAFGTGSNQCQTNDFDCFECSTEDPEFLPPQSIDDINDPTSLRVSLFSLS